MSPGRATDCSSGYGVRSAECVVRSKIITFPWGSFLLLLLLLVFRLGTAFCIQ